MTEPVELGENARAFIRETVQTTLLSLGVDSADAAAVIELQKDFSYLRNLRKVSAGATAKAMFAAVVAAVTGVGAMIVLGVQEWVHSLVNHVGGPPPP